MGSNDLNVLGMRIPGHSMVRVYALLFRFECCALFGTAAPAASLKPFIRAAWAPPLDFDPELFSWKQTEFWR